MLVVVRGDVGGAGDCLLERAEGHQALNAGELVAEAGVLHQRRLAGSEVAHRAVAEPAAVRLDVDPRATENSPPEPCTYRRKASGSPLAWSGGTSRHPFVLSSARSFASPAWMSSAISSVCFTRRGSSINLRNS